MEKWRDIEGFPGYQVSNLGRVRSFRKGKPRILKPNSGGRTGYPYIGIYCDGKIYTKKIHRLVATAFIQNPDNLPIVNHIDGNRENARLENLEWCSQSRNIVHAFNTGRKTITKKTIDAVIESIVKRCSKPVAQLSMDGAIITIWPSARTVHRELGINDTSVTRCCNGKRKSAGGYRWAFI